jgi:hypothetical protein
VEKNKKGTGQLAFSPNYKGGHIVRLIAAGYAPKSKKDFCVTRRISVWADQR